MPDGTKDTSERSEDISKERSELYRSEAISHSSQDEYLAKISIAIFPSEAIFSFGKRYLPTASDMPDGTKDTSERSEDISQGAKRVISQRSYIAFVTRRISRQNYMEEFQWIIILKNKE